MKPDYFNHRFFNSYYYTNILSNLINNRWEFLGFVSQFFENDMIIPLIKPWQKESILHRFIYFVISDTIDDESYNDAVKQLDNAKKRGDKQIEQIYIEWVFENYGFEYLKFIEFCPKELNKIEEDDFYEYYNELFLSSDLEDLFKIISEEVFYIVFNNRSLLLNFNNIVSEYISNLTFTHFNDEYEEYSIYLKQNGQLKREHIPEWIKNAVYYRILNILGILTGFIWNFILK